MAFSSWISALLGKDTSSEDEGTIETVPSVPTIKSQPQEAEAQTSPGSVPPSLGELVLGGRYQLEFLIGRGSSAVVYRAHDQVLSQKVAIKVLLLDGVSNQAEAERIAATLLDEGRAAMRLSHPHILRVYNYEQWGSWEYVVMEYLVGENLGQFVRRRTVHRLSPRELVRYGCETLEALQYAHEQGIVHNDIKPANLMLTRPGGIKVCDFGLARMAGMNWKTIIAGTPAYMSPERFRGQPGDARSDLYSLAATLFTLGNGQTLFGTSLEDASHGHTTVPPPSSSHLPPSLHDVLLKALSKKPEERWASAEEMSVALRKADHRPARISATFPPRLDDIQDLPTDHGSKPDLDDGSSGPGRVVAQSVAPPKRAEPIPRPAETSVLQYGEPATKAPAPGPRRAQPPGTRAPQELQRPPEPLEPFEPPAPPEPPATPEPQKPLMVAGKEVPLRRQRPVEQRPVEPSPGPGRSPARLGSRSRVSKPPAPLPSAPPPKPAPRARAPEPSPLRSPRAAHARHREGSPIQEPLPVPEAPERPRARHDGPTQAPLPVPEAPRPARSTRHSEPAPAPRPRPMPTLVPPPEGMVRVSGGALPLGPGGSEVEVEPYFLDEHPVTCAQYAEFVQDQGVIPPLDWLGREPSEEQRDRPVVNIRLAEARAYATWKGARLPTEREWLAAARGPDGRAFPWGDEWEPQRCVGPEGRSRAPLPVGSAPEGRADCGAHDLLGNVWEMVEASEEGPAPEPGMTWVLGGSYRHSPVKQGRIARTALNERKRYAYVGFRCARSLDELE